MTPEHQDLLFAATGAALFALALRAFFIRPHLIAKVVAANIATSGVFLFLVAAAPEGTGASPDSVAQALVLTGIVISVAWTAYALALLQRLYDEIGAVVLPENDDRG